MMLDSKLQNPLDHQDPLYKVRSSFDMSFLLPQDFIVPIKVRRERSNSDPFRHNTVRGPSSRRPVQKRLSLDKSQIKDLQMKDLQMDNFTSKSTAYVYLFTHLMR